MLVVSRKTQEALQLGDDVRVVVLEIRSDQVKLGVQAPASVKILREELIEQVRASNQGALKVGTDALRSLAAALKPVARWSVEDGELVLEVGQALAPGRYRFPAMA